jgi:hypothetical protein
MEAKPSASVARCGKAGATMRLRISGTRSPPFRGSAAESFAERGEQMHARSRVTVRSVKNAVLTTVFRRIVLFMDLMVPFYEISLTEISI